ncbi:DUF736 domain-containing protein [Nisaea denitrificans]|uniref:DUF736 domain-containing protein n=1 Tax=Nisaea denitrificans TaxID=390877 RepID=UPI00040F3D29|nr:DUF736 domain-containing protein [Nisaea denitrificans]
MATIGYTTKNQDHYKGRIKTVSIDTNITIMPNLEKSTDNAPDFIILSDNFPIGTANAKVGEASKREYLTLYFDSPDLPAHFFVNMIQDPKQDDPNVYVLLWDQKRQTPK